MLNYRKIEAGDDAQLAEIIRANLEKYHLNIPGTVYFDPELNHLSKYYGSDPQKRVYYIALGENGEMIGGVGAAEFSPGFRTARNFRSFILLIRQRAKATERSLSGWRKTGRERRATVICILKLTRISKRR